MHCDAREHPCLRCPAFGGLVSVSLPVGNGIIYGLIYDVGIKDDIFVRQLVIADLPEDVVRDQADKKRP